VSASLADQAVVARVRHRLAESGVAPTPAAVATALRAEERLVDDTMVLDVLATLHADVGAGGPLARLLDDPEISDVLVNGPHDVWVDRGRGLERSDAAFFDEAAVRRFAQRAAAVVGRRLDDASPMVDVRMPDGVRLHAVLPPVSPSGTLLSFRLGRRRSFTLTELSAQGTVSAPMLEALTALVASRLAFLVTGGTGSGKTTLLATLLGCVPERERIVLVEDSGELRPDHPHVVRLEARPPNVEGAGEVTLRDLVRQALRMRPDRLVVGEVRGGEVVDLLAALNTGHEGGCGTVHANASADLPARLEALGTAAGLPRAAVHSQVAASIDAVVHLAREPDGRRRVAEVSVVEADAEGLVRVVAALVCDRHGRTVAGPAIAALERRLTREPW
jgi:pilus assembly protein CpaF